MIDANQTAYIVHVSSPAGEIAADRMAAFYAVLTETPEQAVELVRQAVKPDAQISLTDARLSQDTAQAIGLMPQIARAL